VSLALPWHRPDPTEKGRTLTTEDQRGLVALAWALRLAEHERKRELWFAVEPEALPTAHDLYERKWLSRRIGEWPEWRLTDEGLSALRVDEVRASLPQN
jgi:hypothetical protein